MAHRRLVLVIVLFLFTGALWAQERQSRRSPLRGLKGALRAAGAPELTSEQEEQLRALLAESRQSREPGGREGMGDARQAYMEAILNSYSAAAQLQADIIADQVAAATVSRLDKETSLKIQFLNLLTQDQVDAVLERSGTSGLYRLLGTSDRGRGQQRGR